MAASSYTACSGDHSSAPIPYVPTSFFTDYFLVCVHVTSILFPIPSIPQDFSSGDGELAQQFESTCSSRGSEFLFYH